MSKLSKAERLAIQQKRDKEAQLEDKELIEKAMDLKKQLDLARSTHYADTILRLVKHVEELQSETKSIAWEPKNGEEYWYISGSVLVGVCNRDNCSSYEVGFLTSERLKRHNAYKTQVQAEQAAKYQQRYNIVLQAVLNLEPDQKVDWNDMDQVKYGVVFNNKSGRWLVVDCTFIGGGYPPLTDKKNVQPLLDYLNSKEKSDGR